MYTLINRDCTLCTGFFPTSEVAEYWARTFLPELGLEPVELLTDLHSKEVVEGGDGWTWREGRTIEDVCGQTSLPTC